MERRLVVVKVPAVGLSSCQPASIWDSQFGCTVVAAVAGTGSPWGQAACCSQSSALPKREGLPLQEVCWGLLAGAVPHRDPRPGHFTFFLAFLKKKILFYCER